MSHDIYDRLDRLDLNLLKVFVAIVQAQGISNASKIIHLTQPAVSQSLKKLEAELGVRLVERSPRTFRVTQAGRNTYDMALVIMREVARLKSVATMSGEEEVTGHVRLLLASRVESAQLDDLIARFLTDNPSATLSIDVLPSLEIQRLVRQGQATAGVCLMRANARGFRSRLLVAQVYGPFCGPPHPLYGKKGLTPEDLHDAEIITFGSDQMGAVLSPLTIFRERENLQGRVVATSNNIDEIVRLARLGLGIALLPTHFVERYVRSGELWPLLPDCAIGPLDLYAIWSSDKSRTSAEKVFTENLSALPEPCTNS
ncbi:LysR family transcriptional regulator [Lutimaribacter sp. EGI FJ00015]|uniref:LysR family transcriptional regulator n=1 Tax=Lutimaribacter degradans TaxID=2945989 RepID=A0ACC5ZTU0_9RHOB|nr:LysR family transcriptional regulator [Lutimaribacter sp. EGI FJ00013]MCM2561707.1 LysR family transcriptional regulator [Lutimaribacter sp. EGI FJ00013]MCO0612580.1 LysR family transcriptional regulator [Lutimaribacter sp. EGI FJ00015]MCO0635239.1 LysR family transcriptional regulator [Lutimaribacter sp. EGI FJ00014]